MMSSDTELVTQEALTGQVSGLSIFCMVDRNRFRRQTAHRVSRLTESDRNALQRYARSSNAKAFLRFFDEGKVDVYGAYNRDEMIGCCAAFQKSDEVSWMEVKPAYHHQGYGRCLLSACVEDMLQDHEAGYYDACMDEMANIRVCLAAGFVPLRQTFYFNGRRKRG